MTTVLALDNAIAHAEMGLHVFPVAIGWDALKHKTSKRPLTQHGHLDATCDVRDLVRLFERARVSDSSVLSAGVVPGRSGHVCLDLDVTTHDGVAFADLEGIPLGRVITTASGGQHRYFRKPDTSIRYGNAVPAHWAGLIDVRGDDGWLVLPGTVTPWGSWTGSLDAPGTIEVLPASIHTLLDSRGHSDERGGSWGTFVPERDLPLLHPSTRDAIALLVQHFGAHSLTINRADGREPWVHLCRPGKHAGVSASVGNIGPGVVNVFTSSWPTLPPGVYDVEQIARAAGVLELPGSSGDGDDSGSLYVDLATMIDEGFPVVEPLLGTRVDDKRLFYMGRTNGIFGEPETGKTWLAITVAAEALDKGLPMLYVDIDHNGPQHIANALAQVTGKDLKQLLQYIDDELLLIACPEDRMSVEAVVRDAVTRTPGVAIIDSAGELEAMYQSVTSDVNDRWTVANRLTGMALAAAGWGVLYLDHVRKDGSNSWAIGASAKKRSMRGGYYELRRVNAFAPGRRGSSRMLVRKDAPGGVRSWVDDEQAATFVMEANGSCSFETNELTSFVHLSRSQRDKAGKVLQLLIANSDGLGWSAIANELKFSRTQPVNTEVKTFLLTSGLVREHGRVLQATTVDLDDLERALSPSSDDLRSGVSDP